MDYEQVNRRLQTLTRVYRAVCDEEDVRCFLGGPASERQVRQVEERLGVALPPALRTFFLTFSKDCAFSAFLPDRFQLPDALQGIFSACLHLSLDEVADAEEARRNWQAERFSDAQDPQAGVWHNKLGLMAVANGDVIALDTGANPEEPPVVYLSHDNGKSHGLVLGQSLQAYLDALLSIGGCGNEGWQMLPFCPDRTSGLDPACENAKTYRSLIGLDWDKADA